MLNLSIGQGANSQTVVNMAKFYSALRPMADARASRDRSPGTRSGSRSSQPHVRSRTAGTSQGWQA